MKKIVIISVYCLFTAPIFAAETPINCDEFAQHIEKEVRELENGNGRFYGVESRRATRFHKPRLVVSYFDDDEFEERYCKRDCRQAGMERDTAAIHFLPGRIALFQRYHNALAQCLGNSKSRCPLALQTMGELHERMVNYRQCIDLFNEGEAEKTGKIKAEEKRKAALKKFIDDANRK